METALPAGTKLKAGRYQLKTPIGQGDFGITYRATDSEAYQEVVIKEFFLVQFFGRTPEGKVQPGPFSGAQLRDFHSYFIDEAQKISKHTYESLLNITDLFEENGTHYYVSPFIKGQSLRVMLEKVGRIPEARALQHALLIGAGLHKLHQQHHLHLNITPDNILIKPNGKAVLTGYGLARHFIYSHTSYRVAKYSAYTPMECYQQAEIGAYSDVYSIAAVLFYALSGVRPSTPIQRVEQHLPPVKYFCPEITGQVSQAIDAAMSLDATARPATMKAFFQELAPAAVAAWDAPVKKKEKWNLFRSLFDF